LFTFIVVFLSVSSVPLTWNNDGNAIHTRKLQCGYRTSSEFGQAHSTVLIQEKSRVFDSARFGVNTPIFWVHPLFNKQT